MRKKKIKISYFVLICIIITQVLGLILLYTNVNRSVSKEIKETTIKTMETIVDERSQIINNYVNEVEGYLTAYSRAGEITEVLKNPNDKEAVAKAQKYTETFSKDIENLEGIYVSEWNTHVLAHTNPEVVGITTRNGDPLKSLQDSMLKADGVYNTGFIFSPASGEQIISMYRACYDDNGNPIGLVGGGVYIYGLKDILDKLPTGDLINAKYYLINTNTKEYIFHDLEEMLGAPVETEALLDVIDKVSDEEGSSTGYTEHKENQEDMMLTYNYSAENGWLFVLSDTSTEIFASASRISSILKIFSSIILLLLSIATYIIMKFTMKPLVGISNSLENLSNFDISDNKDNLKYKDRNDDLGEIVTAIEAVLKALRSIILTLKDSSTKINNQGDLLSNSSIELVNGVEDNIATTEELLASMESVNSLMDDISNEVRNTYSSLEEITRSLKNNLSSSDKMYEEALEMEKIAKESFETSEEQTIEIKKAMHVALENLNGLTEINRLASTILDIADNTNLLALNASIEAARAGEAGRGFAVVAEEIGKLAEFSKDTANDITDLCDNSNESIKIVNDYVKKLVSYIEEDIMYKFKSFADKSEISKITSEGIKEEINILNELVLALDKSMGQITESIESVRDISEENVKAITVIVEKNELTSGISSGIKIQSEENKLIARELNDIVDKFILEEK